MKSSLPRGLVRAIAGSVVAHVVFVVAFIALSAWNSRARPRPQHVITTELVRLGKERPKELLPRKPVEPPKAAAPSPAPALQPKPEPAPTKKDEPLPSAKERLSALRNNVSSALERLKTDEEPEGREDGSEHGTSLNAALVTNKFVAELYGCMKANYSLEGLTPEQVRGRAAIVVVRLAADGRVTGVEIEKGSGLDRFDDNVRRSALRCGKVSPPPAEVMAQLREYDGIAVRFRGDDA